jgi:osmotically-inducible protein OsmY
MDERTPSRLADEPGGEPGLVIGPTSGDADVELVAGRRPARSPARVREADARIARTVQADLETSGHVDATAIRVTVTDGLVVLEGRVADATARDIAGRLAAMVAGVRDVDNRLAAG